MSRTSVHAAAFDTRMPGRLVGGAGAGIARRLQACGFLLLADPEPFLVEGVTGPLSEGELQRATLWGRSLVLRMH
jgi:hypothetical protein